VAAQPNKAQKARRWVALGAAVLTTGGVLSIVAGSTAAQALVSPGATTRVSVADDGSPQALLPSFFYTGAVNPSISGTGQFVAFDTQFPLDPLDKQNDVDPAPNVIGQHESDIYVRDRTGNHTVLITRGQPPPAPPKFRYAAAALAGEAAANGDSTDPSISADGRYVAFVTEASNLKIPNEQFPGPDKDHAEIVLCDRDPDGDGVFDEHTVKTDPNSALAYQYTVVSFQDIFQPPGDVDGGFLPSAERINSASEPSLAINRATGTGAVAYTNKDDGTTGVPAPPTEVFVAGFSLKANGQIDATSLEQVWASKLAGQVVPGVRDGVTSPALSRDGTHVAMCVSYHTANPDPASAFGTAIVDTRLVQNDGLQAVEHTRLDVDGQGAPLPGSSAAPTITGTGRQVAFEHYQDAVPQIRVVDRDPDGNGVFWPPTGSGAPPEALDVTVASRNNLGEPGNGFRPALSVDGRYIAFSTAAPNMHNGVDDDSGSGPCTFSDFAAPSTEVLNCLDVVVRDLVVDGARERAGLPRLPGELASPGTRRDCVPTLAPTDTCEGNGASLAAVLSDDGSQVAYESGADDLLGPDGDTNSVGDVFVREFQPTVTGAAVNFGTVDLGSSSTQTAAVQHVGFGPLVLGEVVLSGPDVSDFTVVADPCTGLVMHETDICGTDIRFTPSVTGDRHATLTVTPAGRAPVTIDILGGVGVPPDGFTADPNPLAFTPARLALSPSGPGTVTIGNRGRVPFTITSITRPAGTKVFQNDYTVTRNDCLNRTLAVGGTCTIQVVFTPHGSGTRPGALQVTTVQQGTTLVVPHVVGLTGSGQAAALQVNPGVVPSGRVTSITGQGFGPNHGVLLTIDGFPVTLTATTLADGTFSIPLIVFPHTTTGTHPVSATMPGTTLKATAPMLVVSGSGQPPGFEIRR
jgi:hypothetical protein